MELSEILNSLSTPQGTTEKTASVVASDSLSQAIDRALESSQEKVASHSSAPAKDLVKIANDLATAEQDALIKEAHVYGMAVADGFAARMSSYTGGHSHVGGEENFAVKQAMELGYQHASSAITRASEQGVQEKVASYSAQGQEDAVKVASYLKGQEDAVKVSSYLKGQEAAANVVTELTKIATGYEDYGFQVGNSILKRL